MRSGAPSVSLVATRRATRGNERKQFSSVAEQTLAFRRDSMMVRRGSNERARPHRIKETFWSKLRELWAIRRRCEEIKLQQGGNQPPRSTEFSAAFLRRNLREAVNLSESSKRSPFHPEMAQHEACVVPEMHASPPDIGRVDQEKVCLEVALNPRRLRAVTKKNGTITATKSS